MELWKQQILDKTIKNLGLKTDLELEQELKEEKRNNYNNFFPDKCFGIYTGTDEKVYQNGDNRYLFLNVLIFNRSIKVIMSEKMYEINKTKFKKGDKLPLCKNERMFMTLDIREFIYMANNNLFENVED